MIEFKGLAGSRPDTKILKKLFGKIFSGRKNFELSVVFAPPFFMKKLNKKYRGKNRAANVLAFPLEQGGKGSGEIFLNAAEKNLPHLFIHASLHLLGFDHKKNRDHKTMKQKELTFLKLIKK